MASVDNILTSTDKSENILTVTDKTLSSTDKTLSSIDNAPTTRPTFIQWVESFAARIKSDNTRAAYQRDLQKLFDFADNVESLTPIQAQNFVSVMQDKYSAATVRRVVACVRSFYDFGIGIEAINKNPFNIVKGKDLPKTSVNLSDKMLTAENVTLLKHLSKGSLQHHAIICTLAYTGMRVGDMCSLKWSHLNREMNTVTWTADKTNKSVTVENLPDSFWSALDALPKNGEHVFSTRNGKSIQRSHVNRILKGYAKKLNIPRLTPHMFRHTLASLAHANGASMAAIRDTLGHASTHVTSIYTHVVGENDTIAKLPY